MLSTFTVEPNNLEQAVTYSPLIVSSGTLVTDAIALMSSARGSCALAEWGTDNDFPLVDSRASCVLVMKNHQLVGIFTERDVVRLSAEARKIEGVVIGEIMTPCVITIRKSDFTDIFVVLNLFQRHRIRHLPIMDNDGHLVGLVTHESLRQLLRPVDLLRLCLVSEVMNFRVVQADPETSVLKITKLMARQNVSSVVIVENQDSLLIPIGIVTERDIVQFQALALDLEAIKAQIVMSSPVFCMTPNESLWAVSILMKERRINRVVITNEQGEISGIVTQTTLLQALNSFDIYSMVDNLKQEVSRLEVEKLELLQIRNAELEKEVQKRIAELQIQAERERLLSGITSRIRISLDLQKTLNAITVEVRQFLNCDRVLVYKIKSQIGGIIVAEDVKTGWLSLLGEQVSDPCFTANWIEQYTKGRILVVDDILKDGMTPCHRQLLESLQIRAKILVPIIVGEELWGLLLACQNDNPRIWQLEETELLKQLSNHLAIAIQQAELYQRLKESEESLRTIVETSNSGLVTVDNQGKILFVNPAASKMFGRNQEELCGWPFAVPSDYDTHRVEEIELLQLFGQHRIVQMQSAAITWESEDAFLMSMSDITDLKQTEELLRQSEAKYRLLIEKLPVGLVVHAVDTNILSSNAKACELLELTFAQMQGKTVLDPAWYFLREDETAMPLSEYPINKVLSTLQPLKNYVIGVNRPHSLTQIWLLVNAFPEFDHNNNLRQVIVTFVDISDRQAALHKRKQAEIALKDSEERFRQIAENLPELIWMTNTEGSEIIFVSPQYKEIWGRTCESLYQEPYTWLDAIHEDDRERVNIAFLTKTSVGTYNEEYRIIRPDGKIRWIHDRAFPIKNYAGEVYRITGFAEDITKRKESEEQLRQLNEELEARVEQRTKALQESQTMLQLVLDTIPQRVFWKDNQSIIRGCNLNFAQDLGATPEEIIGQNPYSLPGRIVEKISDYLECDRSVMKSGQSQLHVRETLHKSDGSILWLETNKVPLRNANGNIIGILGTYDDITSRHNAQEALRYSEERFRIALNNSPIVVFNQDLDLRYTWIYNPPLGLTPEEVIGSFDNDLFLPKDAQKLEAWKRQVLKTGQGIRDEIVIGEEDNFVCYVLTIDPLRDLDGEIEGVTCAALDITDRKQMEAELRQTNAELVRATRLKDEFLANMSHELRTPLNAILGISEGLLEEVFGTVSDRQQRAIKTIENSGKHLLELINDILDLSKIEAGKLELQALPVAISYLCDSSVIFVKQQALKKNIQISVELSPNLPDLILDERRIRQVLINLLNNAVKFTPNGGSVKLIVQQEAEGKTRKGGQGGKVDKGELFIDSSQSPNQWMRFSVIDTGIGIAKEELDKLFQPFMQIDSSFNRLHNGTGLGLALVKRLVDLHNGQIIVTSEIGKGSSFIVRIPCVECIEKSQTSDKTILSGTCQILPNTQTQNAQVLIIEDSIVAAEQVARYLHELNMESTIYTQDEGAIDQAIRIQPVLIILDILLPNLSGWEVLQQLRANPQTQNIPILVISVVDERSQAISLGATDYLVKPINREEIRNSLQKILNLKVVSNTILINTPIATVNHIEPTSPPLILLAEDNEANVVTMSSYLGARGYRLAMAKNGQEAVKLTKELNPDIILMDIQMPGMDGLTAMRLIRANQQFRDTPIIALTALAMPGDRDKCIASGANEYFSKPVKLKLLVEKIQYLLNRVMGNG